MVRQDQGVLKKISTQIGWTTRIGIALEIIGQAPNSEVQAILDQYVVPLSRQFIALMGLIESFPPGERATVFKRISAAFDHLTSDIDLFAGESILSG